LSKSPPSAGICFSRSLADKPSNLYVSLIYVASYKYYLLARRTKSGATRRMRNYALVNQFGREKRKMRKRNTSHRIHLHILWPISNENAAKRKAKRKLKLTQKRNNIENLWPHQHQ